MNVNPFIKTTLNEEDTSLISNHYINEVLPTTKQYKEFHMNRFLSLVDNPSRPLRAQFVSSKNLNERQVEDSLIRPILESLGNTLKAQVPLGGDAVDFCVYQPNENIKPDGFAGDYSNTTTIIESKRYGRIENKYFIRKKDNSDEIYQTLNYLRTMNLTLEHTKSEHAVPFIVLTDGYRWRIYSKSFIHNEKDYESHFIEFDLEAIVNCNDEETRNKYLKIFGIFLSKESLAGELLKHQQDSSELEIAVTTALREQTYTALEYIATGIWRAIMKDENPFLIMTLKTKYNIDYEKAKTDEEERSTLLKIIYDKSLVYLLRLLFVLYAEDRNLFNPKEIPKVIKGKNNILEKIIAKGKGIGEITPEDYIDHNYDISLGEIFDKIDKKYNGGLFSKKKHPLLYKLDIDDTLFANAIDNICRVQLKNRIYTVDFSTISVRELGGIYESLLEYKLDVIDKDMESLPSIINKKRIRHNVSKGDLYLINYKGERKATGSYYTPDLIVDHLVKTALDPKLEEARENCHDNFEQFFKNILDIKVVDPAMGSGHMIQAAYTRIISFVHQVFEEMNADGIIKSRWTTDMEYYVRTQVARKCIYGVDLNPMAVELAKLVLWMKVFRTDKPFEFFDYNLACGNSLIGIYDENEATDDPQGKSLFRTSEEIEADIQGELLDNVAHMVEMPRNTTDEVHRVEKYWKEEVRPLQHEISFFYNIKLARWLVPEEKETIDSIYDSLAKKIDNDKKYVNRILCHDPEIPEEFQRLAAIDDKVRKEFRPLHWKVAYPHVAVKGGFSVVLSNPPWDKIKPNHNEFFCDYISRYAYMEASAAKEKASALMAKNPSIAKKWKQYKNSIELQNNYYQSEYKYQIVKGADGKMLKGDANLYKVFLEKIYTILHENGNCGIVIPDNLNIDNGCTGLRRLLLNHTTIKELIMFENRKKLFDIDSRYKFDVLTFCKKRPRANASFDAGFYWYDPVWLDGKPDADYIAQNERNKKVYHNRYSYSLDFIKTMDSNKLTIYEFKNKNVMQIFAKLIRFPKIGDEKEALHIKTFREFDMTFDSDLFNHEDKGWPLYQGKTIHFFNNHLNPVERYVLPEMGEERLAKKKKCEPKMLPTRQFTIGWRAIAQPTDTRSLICTIIPRGTFCGNSINQAEVYLDGEPVDNKDIISGINTIFSSHIIDFFVRSRIAKNVNAFIVKLIPVISDMNLIEELGKMAMPLYDGMEYDAFREDIPALTDETARNKLIAKLDARIAILYGLTYEEYQTVLSTFPLEDEQQKKRCLLAYNDWKFSM